MDIAILSFVLLLFLSLFYGIYRLLTMEVRRRKQIRKFLRTRRDYEYYPKASSSLNRIVKRAEATQTDEVSSTYTHQRRLSATDRKIYETVADHFPNINENRYTKYWVRNLIIIPDRDFLKMIYDEKYLYTASERSRPSRYTYAYIKTKDRQLPYFNLNLFERTAAKDPSEGINFDSHPEFSKRYLLISDQEHIVRQFFSAELLEFFEKNTGFGLYCSANRIQVSISGQAWKAKAVEGLRVKTKYLPEYLETIEKLLGLLDHSIKKLSY